MNENNEITETATMAQINKHNDLEYKYTNSDIKKIVSKIERLKNKKHHINILKIILEETRNYTETQNGILLLMNELSNDTIGKISDYLKCITKKQVDNTSSNKETITNDIFLSH